MRCRGACKARKWPSTGMPSGPGPGGGSGGQSAVGEDRQVAFYPGAVVEDDGDAIGVGADRARRASQVGGVLWLVEVEQAPRGALADGVGARHERAGDQGDVVTRIGEQGGGL